MEPPYQFQHVKIATCWPTSEETLWQAVQRITRTGYGSPWAPGSPPRMEQPSARDLAETLAPHGCLQVALRGTDPFKGCDEDHLWVLHYDTDRRKSVRCGDRRQLIEGLADTLLMYENGLNNLQQQRDRILEELKRSLYIFEIAAQVSRTVRKRRSSPKRPTMKDLRTTHRTLTRLGEILTPEDYLQAAKFSRLDKFSNPLVRDMYKAFDDHGPSREDRPGIVVDTAIAAILIQFGIEAVKQGADPLQTLAARLRMRFNRSKPPADS